MSEAEKYRKHLAVDILARTIWGEARGEGAEGMKAVACVVMNRLAVAQLHSNGFWWGNTVIQICQARMQFSCWNGNDPNLKKLLAVSADDEQFGQALGIAVEALDGDLNDITNGATHYIAAGAHADWTVNHQPCEVIGRHIFYQLEPVPVTPKTKEIPMSKFTDTRDAVEKWFLNGFHKVWVAIAPGLEKGGEAIATHVVTAIAEAHNNGVTGHDLLNTGINAAKTSAITIGVDIGLEEAAALVGLAVGHVTPAHQDAPLPPA